MAVLVLTTVPDIERGETIARALVDERLAACVNVGPPMFSFYRWQGATQRDSEHQLLIKTVRENVAAVQGRIAELHPYELPEFLVVAVADGGADYLAWIKAETGGPGTA
jgi:periplasmic divalent cation tolerance protein